MFLFEQQENVNRMKVKQDGFTSTPITVSRLFLFFYCQLTIIEWKNLNWIVFTIERDCQHVKTPSTHDIMLIKIIVCWQQRENLSWWIFFSLCPYKKCQFRGRDYIHSNSASKRDEWIIQQFNLINCIAFQYLKIHDVRMTDRTEEDHAGNILKLFILFVFCPHNFKFFSTFPALFLHWMAGKKNRSSKFYKLWWVFVVRMKSSAGNLMTSKRIHHHRVEKSRENHFPVGKLTRETQMRIPMKYDWKRRICIFQVNWNEIAQI